MAITTFNHPILGEILGVEGDGTLQFRGIKYASLANRLAEPEIQTKYSSPIDATKYGPLSPQAPAALDAEFSFIQHRLPVTDYTQSCLDALNLVITVPRGVEKSDKPLPVFVYLHGGGFALGGNGWPQYNQARLVRLSLEQGMPVIGVGINYRLGLTGLITSEELRAAGIKPNRFLRDQRVAFNWLRKYVGGFGGDSNNITGIGESAGAVSLGFHLQSEEKLCDRIVCTGATSLLMKPLPPSYHEATYQMVISGLNLQDKSVDERIDALCNLPIDHILKALPPNMAFMHMIDGDLIKRYPRFDEIGSAKLPGSVALPGSAWCKALMVGYCQFDASIISIMIGHKKANIGSTFRASFGKSLSENPTATAALLAAYGLDKDDSDDSSNFLSILRLANDISFYAPALTFARGWPGECYLFCFNEPNPWDGPWKGEATHILDVAFLFQNYNEFLSPAQMASAKAFGADVLKFVSSQELWTPFSEAHPTTKVYGPSSSTGEGAEPNIKTVQTLSTERKQNEIILEFGSILGLDKISLAWDMFMGSP